MNAFLFTDLVESSTRLWEQHPEEMKGALATHDRTLGREMVNPEPRASRGDVLSAASAEHPQIGEAYRSAIRGARISGLKMVKLQARTGLVPLLRETRDDDGIDELRAVYDSTRGGDDEPDVRDAGRLLH